MPFSAVKFNATFTRIGLAGRTKSDIDTIIDSVAAAVAAFLATSPVRATARRFDGGDNKLWVTVEVRQQGCMRNVLHLFRTGH